MITQFIKRNLSKRTIKLAQFDYLRFKARNFGNPKQKNKFDKLHLGCGNRKIEGWLNIDVIQSDYDVDLAAGKLPFASDSFDCVVSQHVIEHLELEEELIPLLKELYRTMKVGGEIWLSCPDLEKVCKYYFEDKGVALVEDRKQRFPKFSLNGVPAQHMINVMFHQGGEHKNLFDFELLEWTLQQAGFKDIKQVNETIFLNRFPEFMKRNDDSQSLYVMAIK